MACMRITNWGLVLHKMFCELKLARIINHELRIGKVGPPSLRLPQSTSSGQKLILVVLSTHTASMPLAWTNSGPGLLKPTLLCIGQTSFEKNTVTGQDSGMSKKSIQDKIWVWKLQSIIGGTKRWFFLWKNVVFFDRVLCKTNEKWI